MGMWQQEIVLRSSNCSFKLICETVSGGGGGGWNLYFLAFTKNLL